jgi:hypothetical protein
MMLNAVRKVFPTETDRAKRSGPSFIKALLECLQRTAIQHIITVDKNNPIASGHAQAKVSRHAWP